MSDNQLTPISILLASVILASSVVYHANVLSGKGLSLGLNNKEGTKPSAVEQNPETPTEVQEPQFATVSVDDDPVLGDENAPVTLIEFSDYECPFCQRHFQQTHPELVSNFIDTGKVKLVFRDLPLSFHDPVATKAAMGANCAREQGGDQAYFTFHDLWFSNTAANGTGLPDDKLKELLSDAGLNADNIFSCIESGKYKEEVQSDLSDAQNAGASATPTFFIGKTPENGKEVEAEILVGAQPYSAFESLINKYMQ